MNMDNMNAAEKLLKRYETITLEEIEECFKSHKHSSARKLTGFGSVRTCTLCVDVNLLCNKCIYNILEDSPEYGWKCNRGSLKRTYFKIHNSNTPEDLLVAFRQRAKLLRFIIRRYKKLHEKT